MRSKKGGINYSIPEKSDIKEEGSPAYDLIGGTAGLFKAGLKNLFKFASKKATKEAIEASANGVPEYGGNLTTYLEKLLILSITLTVLKECLYNYKA